MRFRLEFLFPIKQEEKENAPETSYWLIQPAKSDFGKAGPLFGFDVPG